MATKRKATISSKPTFLLNISMISPAVDTLHQLNYFILCHTSCKSRLHYIEGPRVLFHW
jgi:hypothetical protein